jgi:hypothetical protein
MTISVSLIEASRLGVQVDTPADLARARQLMKSDSLGQRGASFDTAASRPAQDEEINGLPHAEERPKGRVSKHARHRCSQFTDPASAGVTRG